MATTLGSDEASVYYPAVSRWIELGFVGGHPRLHCDRLNVRRVERRISFPEPEKGCIYLPFFGGSPIHFLRIHDPESFVPRREDVG